MDPPTISDKSVLSLRHNGRNLLKYTYIKRLFVVCILTDLRGVSRNSRSSYRRVDPRAR